MGFLLQDKASIHFIIKFEQFYVRIHSELKQAMPFSGHKMEMVLNINSYPVSQGHKGKSVTTTEELFSTFLKRHVLKLKTMNKSIHEIIHFYIKQLQIV